jgi:hypothetical protein
MSRVNSEQIRQDIQRLVEIVAVEGRLEELAPENADEEMALRAKIVERLAENSFFSSGNYAKETLESLESMHPNDHRRKRAARTIFSFMNGHNQSS